MKLTKEEVEKVGKLARLEITDTEKDAFAEQLSHILDYVDQLNTWDPQGLEPTSTVLEQVNCFRQDKVRPSLPVDTALANAPESEGGFFRVPKIIEDY